MKPRLLALALILTSSWLAAGEVPEGHERHILVLARGAQNQVTDLRNTVQHLGGTVEEAGEGWMVVTTPARGLAQLRAHAAVRYVQRVGTATADAGASLPPPPTLPGASHGSLTWSSGTYAYDGAGNIVGIGTSSAPGTQGYRTYGYDKLSRLTSATSGPAGAVLAYEYDAYGNRTRYALNGSWDTIPVSETTNRFTDATYDAVGSQTARGSTSGTYDGFGMLTSYQFAPGNPQTFVYTPNDERIGVLQGTDWTWSLRDANGRVLRQYRSSSTSPSAPWVWVEDFVYRDGLLLGGERAPDEGGRRHFHLDHLGTPRLVTGATGELISEHELLPFGEERTPIGQHQARGFDREEPHRFTGHERDFETRTPNDSTAYVDYLHARYYEPKAGRFLSVDPTWESADLGKPQSWNR